MRRTRLEFFAATKSAGFSLVEAMIATSILTATGFGILTLSQIANEISMQLRVARVAMTAKSAIEASMRNPSAWHKTLTQNSTSFACAKTAPGCNLPSGDGYNSFVLYDSNSQKVTYDPGDPKTRYSLLGVNCEDGVSDHNPQCPLKYVAQWKPLCQTYPCVNPSIEIRFLLIAEFGSNGPIFNTQKYDYVVVRGIDDGSVRSACQILNGIYNEHTGTCLPKYAGKSCATTLGKPAQIISAVDGAGNLTCAPLYTGQCNPDTEIINGINASGVAQCAPRSQPTNCPTPCIGAWGGCSQVCGGGTQTYNVIVPAANGGRQCTSPAPGSTQACNVQACPVNCAGTWSGCSETCGGGQMTFTIATVAAHGGVSCTNSAGDTQACNTQACAIPVNCGGSWSTCDQNNGTTSFTITQSPQNGGAACPASPKPCSVNCVGSWGACNTGSERYKTYAWITPPKNGGTSCPYINGQTDKTGCEECIRYGHDGTGSPYVDGTGNYGDGTGSDFEFGLGAIYESRESCEDPPGGFDIGEWCFCR